MKDYSDFIDSQFIELNKIILKGKSVYVKKCQIFTTQPRLRLTPWRMDLTVTAR